MSYFNSHLHIIRNLLRGQTLMRILMNQALAQERISGTTVDLGGGRHPDYVTYLQADASVTIEPVDLSISGIDFEHDPLPYASGTVDTVLMCNILEHLYHHQHLVSEARRILRPSGSLIGFVPFWIGYHPDPHDYFRYTNEALERILSDAGFSRIRITTIGGGPLLANFNTIVLSVPRIVRPLLYGGYAIADALFLKLRPVSRQRNPLGYLFTAQ